MRCRSTAGARAAPGADGAHRSPAPGEVFTRRAALALGCNPAVKWDSLFPPHLKEAGAGLRGFQSTGFFRVGFEKSFPFPCIPGSTPSWCFGPPHRGAGGCSQGQDQPGSVASPAAGRWWATHPVLWAGGRGPTWVPDAPGMEKPPCVPPAAGPHSPDRKGGVGVWRAVGIIHPFPAASCLPALQPLFSLSIPFPLLRRPPQAPHHLPPSPPLLFPLRDPWGHCPSRSPGSTQRETQCLGMPWPTALPAQSPANRCPCAGMDPHRGPLQAGIRLGLPLARGRLWLSGRAAGCAFPRMLTSFTFPGITGIRDGAAVLRALFLSPPWTKGWRFGMRPPRGGVPAP